MKILNLIWKFGTGGIAKCFLTYASLGEVEQDIEVVSACIDPQNCNYDRKPLLSIGANIIKIKNGKDISWMSKTSKLIKDVQPDVIFCHGFNGPIVVALLKLRYHIKAPVVCSYHGVYYAPTPKKKCLERVFNGLMYLFYKHMAKRIIVVSDYSKRELEKNHIPTKKIEVVHNGIKDLDEKPETPTNEIVRIGVVSRLDPFKGIDILIQAMHVIKSNTKFLFSLDIVGDGPMDMQLKQMVKDLGVQDIVCFAGYQTNIPEWMKKWDIFCLPSFFENHSISILEAMRSGKAIVTTQVGGNEESVTNAKEALVVPAKNVEKLADALTELIENKKLRINLGIKARERYLKDFTEDVMKRNLVDALRK